MGQEHCAVFINSKEEVILSSVKGKELFQFVIDVSERQNFVKQHILFGPEIVAFCVLTTPQPKIE